MPTNFSEFLTKMDERLWFRMIVCFLPGLVVAKLFGFSTEGSVLSYFTTAVLVIGIALYAFWNRLRGLPAASEAEEDETEGQESYADDQASAEQSAQDLLALVNQLRTLCREEERESDRLIAMEIAVNPQLTFSEAVNAAITRRRITSM